MDDNDIILAFHNFLESWQKRNPKKSKLQVYEELLEMLSIAADEHGVFEEEEHGQG